jgi:hypothetical protein
MRSRGVLCVRLDSLRRLLKSVVSTNAQWVPPEGHPPVAPVAEAKGLHTMRRQMPTRAEPDTSWVQPQPVAFRMPRNRLPDSQFAVYFEQKRTPCLARVRLCGRGCSRTLHTSRLDLGVAATPARCARRNRGRNPGSCVPICQSLLTESGWRMTGACLAPESARFERRRGGDRRGARAYRRTALRARCAERWRDAA